MAYSSSDPIFQVITMGNHGFPGIWRYLMPEDFSFLRFPVEDVTTCADCYEVAVGYYPPECRCCTHFNQMPNYMIGLALMNPDTRSIIEPVIESRQTLPQGRLPTPRQFEASVETYSKNMFGRNPQQNCVFIDPKTFECRVYPFRNSVCSTFFCQTDHGKVGDKFWEEVQVFTGQVEIALEHWCMDEMGLEAANYVDRMNGLASSIETISDPFTENWSEVAYRSLWGSWYGREIEFFTACAQLAMDRRGELYDIARSQPTKRPLEYERAERLFVPKEHRHEAPKVPSDDCEVVSIDDIWYKLQLVHRRLWELPYNEGEVVLGSDVTIESKKETHLSLRVFASKTHVASRRVDGKVTDTFYLSPVEESALRFFEEPRVVGEFLFEHPSIAELEDPREFLSKCMRRGYIVDAENISEKGKK